MVNHEDALLKRCKAGDSDALNSLIIEYTPLAKRAVYKYGGSPGNVYDNDDILQEVLLDFARLIPTFEDNASRLPPFLWVVAKNSARSRANCERLKLRRRRYPRSLDEPRRTKKNDEGSDLHEAIKDPGAEEPAEAVIVGEQAGKVLEAMGCLDPIELSVIRERYGFVPVWSTENKRRWAAHDNSFARSKQAVAERLEISVGDVRDAEARALIKLRAWPDDPPPMRKSGAPGIRRRPIEPDTCSKCGGPRANPKPRSRWCRACHSASEKERQRRLRADQT